MAAPADTITDLYGFPVKVYVPQVKERADCDATVEKEQLNWMPYIEKERLPNSESKTKEMICKVNVCVASAWEARQLQWVRIHASTLC